MAVEASDGTRLDFNIPALAAQRSLGAFLGDKLRTAPVRPWRRLQPTVTARHRRTAEAERIAVEACDGTWLNFNIPAR